MYESITTMQQGAYISCNNNGLIHLKFHMGASNTTRGRYEH
jgi:hypothetical protein